MVKHSVCFPKRYFTSQLVSVPNRSACPFSLRIFSGERRGRTNFRLFTFQPSITRQYAILCVYKVCTICTHVCTARLLPVINERNNCSDRRRGRSEGVVGKRQNVHMDERRRCRRNFSPGVNTLVTSVDKSFFQSLRVYKQRV